MCGIAHERAQLLDESRLFGLASRELSPVNCDKALGLSLEAYICAMGPHKPPKCPFLYQKQPSKIQPRHIYIGLGYVKQQRVAVELFLSFCIDIEGNKDQKCAFWGVFCIFGAQNESE